MNIPHLSSRRLLLEDEPLFVDVETTGLLSSDQLTEIAIIDHNGRTVLESLVQPINLHSLKRQGSRAILPYESLRNAPLFSEIAESVANRIEGRTLAAYNANFDANTLTKAAKIAGANLAPHKWWCALNAYHELRGFSPSLGIACEIERVRPLPNHRALPDARACLALIRRLADLTPLEYGDAAESD